MKIIERIDLWNNGFVELWDFQSVNLNQKNREEAVALVGGACRNVTIKNSEKFYKRLLTEHNGKPSEIFQFIPYEKHLNSKNYPISENYFNNFYKFGHLKDGHFYGNIRNIIYKNIFNDKSLFNKKPSKEFVVFKIKIPYMIVDHLRRHKLLTSAFSENWQSNRSKHKKDYFYPNIDINNENDWNDILEFGSVSNLSQMNIRPELTNKGEFGLRYVTGWIGGWMNDPYAWDNFFEVRLNKPTQKETMLLADIMFEMLKHEYNYKIKQ